MSERPDPASSSTDGAEAARQQASRGIARRIADHPGLQLVVCGVLLAVLFPARSSGAIGMTIIGGALGIGVAALWPRAPAWLRRPPEDVATAMVVTVVVAAGLTVFWDSLTISPDWLMGDWGPQHAVIAHAIKSMPGFDAPVWTHELATGDAPLELYPAFANLVTGNFAVIAGLEHDIPRAQMIIAVIVHVILAGATTVIALRIAPKPIALVVGLLTLVDTGAIAHGGTVGLFRWALTHSAMALAFSLITAIAILAALRRPRLSASIAIWLGTALATATHPAGLISAAAAILGLAAVALLATDIPPRRALAAIGHVALGAMIGAVVWMPLAERILTYGQHFPNALRSPGKLLEDLLAAPSPVTAYAMLGYAGYFGILAGLWSRKSSVVFVCAVALILLLGLSDVGYMAYDIAPGQGVARLGTERLAQLARAFVMAAGAYGIAVFVRSAIAGWSGASPRHRLVAAALIGIMSAAVLRVAPSIWWNASQRAANEAKVFAPDRLGRDLLTEWAREQVKTIGPTSYARALFETDTHEHHHLTALTGLPTLHNSWLPDIMLRERMEDVTEPSLRRFNIRWVIASGKSPSLGDPATEQVLGTFHIRELSSWDGTFARIEQGTGEVKVLRLDNEAVEIEVTGTTEPVLVALGTGHYPRWRARHASGASEPIYAMKSYEGATLHVVSAWVAPGRTTFTVDGPLPSDHSGRTKSLLAALLAIAGIIVWSIPRLRLKILRRFARARARLPRATHHAVRFGIPVLVILLLARGCLEDRGVTRSLELGTGVRSTATVEARTADGIWETCGYARVEGVHSCDGLVVATDGMANTLNDAMPSWGFNTPAIVVTPDEPDAEVKIRLRGRLAGTYWTAVSDGTATLEVEGEESQSISRSVLVFEDRGERDIELRAKLPLYSAWSWTFVHEDTLLPARDYLVPPPSEPPPAIRAIR